MDDLVAIVLPEDIQEGTESFIEQWLKKPGDTVAIHEPLVEISTDKATVEVPAPKAGRLKEIIKQAKDKIEPGEVLGRIEITATTTQTAQEKTADTETTTTKTNTTAPRLSPAVRKLLEEHQIDAAQVQGSGQGGRITHQDVTAFIEAQKTSSGGEKTSTLVPHTSLRRTIANHMAASVATAPHVTALFEADMSAIIAHRKQNKERFAEQNVPLTFTAYFVSAAVKALQAVPEVNSRWHDEHLEIFNDYNIGIGAALEERGVVVPVIHKAQELDLFATAKRLHELTEKTRSNQLTSADMQGGTFTISNHGVSGSLMAAPIIIHQPQSAILGIGKVEKRIVVRDKDGEETTEIRPMAYVTLTIDHRALDAHHTNKFLQAFVEALESFA